MLGYVKIQGSGYYYTDYGGDGLADHWQFEEQTMVAVPEPARAWSMLAGLLVLGLFWRARAGRRP